MLNEHLYLLTYIDRLFLMLLQSECHLQLDGIYYIANVFKHLKETQQRKPP